MKNKSILTSLLPAVVTITFTSSLLSSAFAFSYKEQFKQVALVGSMSVSAPLERFLLVSKGRAVCALRFTNYNFFASAGSGPVVSKVSAEYDYFFQNDGSGDFKKSNVETGHLKVGGSYVGINTTLGGGATSTSVMCGSLELTWDGYVGVKFFQGTEPQDEGIKLAPTKWQDVNKIDLNDIGFTWYHYDKTRKTFTIPVDNIW
jgi:hypothetical protein